MKLDTQDSKKDIELSKMYNMSACYQNKDEIL